MDDVVFTEKQIRQAFHCFALEARAADIAILHVLPGGPTLENVAEYIWDHWMGEPAGPSLDEVTAHLHCSILVDP